MSKVKLALFRRNLSRALDRVGKYIEQNTDRDNKFSKGLARESYWGGYEQALRDVGLMLDDVAPNDSRTREFWQ